MKFTFFGLTLSSSWGNGHATPYRALLRGLAQSGHEITFYEKDAFYYAKHRDFTSCDYAKLVLYSDWEEIAHRALGEAAESDVVVAGSFLPEGARINDELLGLATPVRVYYDLDTPVTLAKWRAGETVEYVREDHISGFDLVLSFTGGKSLDTLKQTYKAKAVRALYGCVDPDIHRNGSVPADYGCALSYMATYAADRQPKVERLLLDVAREMPYERFVLAGSLYPWGMPISTNVKLYPHVSPDDHWAIYSGSRATLNITRDVMAENGYCPSGRLFEAAACGVPVISDRWDGIGEFFTDQEEILLADSTADVVSALHHGDLRQIGERAREKTLALHTGRRRAQELIAAIESVHSTRNFAEVA